MNKMNNTRNGDVRKSRVATAAEMAGYNPHATDPKPRRVVHVAMCPPAVRMVVIRAWAWIDSHGNADSEASIEPVVGLRTTNYSDGTTAEDVLFVCDDFGIVGSSDYRTAACHECRRIVACPWSPDADDARLAAEVGIVRQLATEACHRHEGGKA